MSLHPSHSTSSIEITIPLFDKDGAELAVSAAAEVYVSAWSDGQKVDATASFTEISPQAQISAFFASGALPEGLWAIQARIIEGQSDDIVAEATIQISRSNWEGQA